MPRLNVYLPDAVYELASKWRESANLSDICARAIKDELGAAEEDRSYSKVLDRIKPPSDLEMALAHRFGLSDIVLAPAPHDENELRNAIGRAAASFLDHMLGNGAQVAVAGGRQVWSTVQHLSPRRIRSTLTALGIHRADPQMLHVHPNTIVTLMWLLYSPRSMAHLVGTPTSLGWLKTLPSKIDPTYFVFSSCSRFVKDSAFGRLLGADIANSLVQRGAVGDYAYIFFDDAGEEVALSETADQFRLSSQTLRDLSARTDCKTILAAGGDDKVQVIRIVLEKQLCNTLITDESTAERLLT